MDQLSLFPAVGERPGALAAELPSADEASPDSVVGGTSQMGLFDARVRELRAVRQAIASGALDEALSRLRSVGAGSDFDPSAARERVSRIAAEISEAGRSAGQESAALLAALGRRLAADGEPWSSLGRVLVLRAAAVVEDGPGSLAGRLYQEAGELDRARSVLASALARARSASLLFALGDVETLRGQSTAARRWYRDALLLDPFDPAFESVLDGDVRSLPDVAEGDVEIESEPRAWAAAVGIVAGVLAPPREGDARRDVRADGASSKPDPGRAAALEALGRMRRFVEALVLTTAPHVPPRPDALIEARRTMKRASPALFGWYMGRLGGSRGETRGGQERASARVPSPRSAT